MHSINLVSDELAVQVKRHRDKRRKRRESRAAAASQNAPVAGLDGEVVLEGGEVVLEAQVEPLPPGRLLGRVDGPPAPDPLLR